jgi:hypothetical protein
MVFPSHGAIFGRVDHDILVRNFVRPGLSWNKGWDAQEGPTEISTVKPERLALAFRSLLRLRRHAVDRISVVAFRTAFAAFTLQLRLRHEAAALLPRPRGRRTWLSSCKSTPR